MNNARLPATGYFPLPVAGTYTIRAIAAFAVVQMLDLRVGRYPQDIEPTWYGIFGDTNAPDTDHWYYRLAEEDKPEGWAFFKQPGGLVRDSADAPWRENPAAENIKNLPEVEGREEREDF